MGDKSWTAKTGQWMISSQGKTLQEFSADARILSLHFRCQWPTGENLFAGTDAVTVDAKEFPRLERSATALQQLAHRHFPAHPQRFFHANGRPADFPAPPAAFLPASTGILRGDGAPRALSQPFRQRRRTPRGRGPGLARDATRPAVSPPLNCARRSGLGRAHLDRLYWKETASRPARTGNALREESATRSLETTRLSIKEIG